MHVRLNSPPHRPELSEGFTSLIHLNPADSQLSDQINRALQTILDPLAMKKGEQVMHPLGSPINVIPTAQVS